MVANKKKDDSSMDIEKPEDVKEVEKKEEKTVNPRVETVNNLRLSIASLEKGVQAKDRGLIVRVTRSLASFRKQIDTEILELFVKENLSSSSELEKELNAWISSASFKREAEEVELSPNTPKSTVVPEVEVFIQLLIVGYLIDNQQAEKAAECAANLADKITSYNRRTLDYLSAKVYFFYSLTHENIGEVESIRNYLIRAHRTACLHHDEPGQVALTNAILRNYLACNLYNQADKFHLNTKLPESGSTAQYARVLYYIGRIEAIQLHYSKAFNNLSLAIRKAPRKGAIGFRQTVTKLLCIVQLLLGEIPDRSLFRQPELRRSLKPYFQITQAIRGGDVTLFKETMEKYQSTFHKDKNYCLIVRLRHNVIKTGLRNINLSYSRISLEEVAKKLHLQTATDAEYIVAKAVSDGVINATIDRKSQCMFSNENIDIYSTQEPLEAFNKRIQFCMDVHNSAVKSLRFPEHAPKTKLDEEEEDDILDLENAVIVEDDD